MSTYIHTLYKLYSQLSIQHGKRTLHDKLWDRNGDSESPEYNVFMCLLDALETCKSKEEFIKKTNSIVIYHDDNPITVNVDYVADDMVHTLFDIQDGNPMKGF